MESFTADPELIKSHLYFSVRPRNNVLFIVGKAKHYQG